MKNFSRFEFKCPTNVERCANCNKLFKKLRPQVKEIRISKRFIRDYPNLNIQPVIECDYRHSKKLHKFEFSIDGHHVFRALIGKTHLIYAIDKDLRLIFLRAFDNMAVYNKFLKEKKKLATMIENI